MVVGIQSRPGTGCYLSVQLGTPGVGWWWGIQSRPGTGCYLSVQLGTPGGGWWWRYRADLGQVVILVYN